MANSFPKRYFPGKMFMMIRSVVVMKLLTDKQTGERRVKDTVHGGGSLIHQVSSCSLNAAALLSKRLAGGD